MFAPVPLEPVLTELRRIVNALTPLFRELLRRLSALFSTLSAVLIGAGGGAGGGGGSGILGTLHIVKPWLIYSRFEFYFVR